MNNQYKFHSYAEKHFSNTQYGELITQLDLSLGFFQLLPKSFEVPSLMDDKTKDSYYLSFFVTFKFILKNEQLRLKHFRFSLSGNESHSNQHEDFKKHSSHEIFPDFIKKQYSQFMHNKHTFVYDNITYHISDEDYRHIIEGKDYLSQIFPNNKNIIIIDEPGADFYKGNDGGLEDGIKLYENSRVFASFSALDKKFPLKEQTTKTKHKKI